MHLISRCLAATVLALVLPGARQACVYQNGAWAPSRWLNGDEYGQFVPKDHVGATQVVLLPLSAACGHENDHRRFPLAPKRKET